MICYFSILISVLEQIDDAKDLFYSSNFGIKRRTNDKVTTSYTIYVRDENWIA